MQTRLRKFLNLQHLPVNSQNKIIMLREKLLCYVRKWFFMALIIVIFV